MHPARLRASTDRSERDVRAVPSATVSRSRADQPVAAIGAALMLGSLLAAVDRLRVEITAAAREVDPPEQPEAPLAKQVRRWVDSMEAATSRLAD